MTQVESLSVSPAVSEAKDRQRGGKPKVGEVVELSTGVRARINLVPPGLIEDVVNRVKDPEVPIFFDPNKEREMPNPNHPDYIKGIAQAERDRSIASIEAIVLFGLELVDGLPEDDSWLKKLKLLEKRGHFDLSSYDMDDELDREFVYKRYIALGTEDFTLLTSAVSGLDQEEIEKARRTFRDEQTRDSN